MTDLVAFLTAQLDHDEQVARASTAGPWWDSKVGAAPGCHTIRGGPGEERGADGSLPGDVRPIARIRPVPNDDGGYATNHDADAAHIALHDPSHVLRTVAAHRAILERHQPMTAGSCDWCWGNAYREEESAWPCADVRSIAAIYTDREGWDPSWRAEE